MISIEDIIGEFRGRESVTNPKTGQVETREIVKVDRLIDRIVKTMVAREDEGRNFGVVVIAEGVAEFLPMKYLEGIPRDDHGHISISQVALGRMLAGLVAECYQKTTGRKRKVNGLQLGYESRCAKPSAFDVMLGSQLGVGAYRALVEKNLNGVMVSVKGQLELHYEPFDNLVDRKTLVTKVRYIDPESDFHSLARFLETDVNQ